MKRLLAIGQGTIAAGVLVAELAYLGSVLWRHLDPDAPTLAELADRLLERLAAETQYREAVRRTLDSIHALPETDGPE